VKERLNDVKSVQLWTHDSARHLNKSGPLHNPADRDHCIQYIAAVGLIYGRLTAEDYEDHIAADPRIDRLRAKMRVTISTRYTRDLRDPAKRANAHAIEIRFKDGTRLPKVEVQYPLGHPRRRAEGLPLLLEKFRVNLARRYAPKQQQAILAACADQQRLEQMAVNAFMGLFVG
jgi:2-methylcitrate dehydratase PrpD